MELYTIEKLIPECVGRSIADGRGNVRLSNLISSNMYAQVWDAYTHWLRLQFDAGHSISLEPMGVVIRQGPQRLPNFQFSREFLQNYGLKLKDVNQLGDDDRRGKPLKPNLSIMSKAVGYEASTVQIALSHVFTRLGEVLQAKTHRVMIEFGVGTLVSTSDDPGNVGFIFHEVVDEQGRLLHASTVHDAEEEEKKSKLDSAARNAMRHKGRVHKPKRREFTKQEISELRAKYPVGPAAPSSPSASQQRPELLRQGSSEADETYRTLQHGNIIQDTVVHHGKLSEKVGLRPLNRVRDVVASKRKGSTMSQRTAAPSTSTGLPASGSRQFAPPGSMRAGRRPEDASMPPVLDHFAHTRAATYDEHRYFQSTSAKIASFYTPTAAQWRLDEHSGKPVSTGFVPFEAADAVDKIPLHMRRRSVVEAHASSGHLSSAEQEELKQSRASFERYQHYIDHGMSNRDIAPIKEEWIRNALSLLANDVTHLEESQVEDLLRQMMPSVKDGYVSAMKQSILNYVLLNPKERQRLGISVPPACPPEWGKCSIPPTAPYSWRLPIQQAYHRINQNLYAIHPSVVALLSVWRNKKYNELLLVDLPNSPDSRLLPPFTASDFEKQQKKRLEEVKQILSRHWWAEVQLIFQQLVEQNDLDESVSQKLFDCVATVMSIQLRGIVERSIEALNSFFVKYMEAPPIQFRGEVPGRPSLQKRSLTSITPHAEHQEMVPMFQVRMALVKKSMQALQDEQSAEVEEKSAVDEPDLARSQFIGFETSLVEMEECISRTFDTMATGLNGIQRVENKIFALLEDKKNINVNVGEPPRQDLLRAPMKEHPGEHIWGLKNGVLDSFRLSMEEAELLAELYEEYSYVLTEHHRVDEFLSQPHSLEEFENEIHKYRALSKKIMQDTQDIIYGRMFVLDCVDVNQRLSNKAHDLAERIMNHVAKKCIELSSNTAEKIQHERAVLLKKPTTTEELVKLVEHLDHFKKTEKDILTGECFTARDQVNFLLKWEFPVGRDIWSNVVGGKVLKQVGESWKNLKDLDVVIQKCEQQIQAERESFVKNVRLKRDTCQKMLEQFEAQAQEFESFGEPSKASIYLDKIGKLKASIANAEKEIEAINRQEELLDLGKSDFANLKHTREVIQPIDDLAHLAEHFSTEYKTWRSKATVFTLDASEVSGKTEQWFKQAYGLTEELGDGRPEPAKVANFIMKDLEQFKPYVPLVQVLANKGMRERHWAEAREVVGPTIAKYMDPKTKITLDDMIAFRVQDHLPELQIISDKATREWKIEKAIDEVEAFWKTRNFGLVEHKETHSQVMEGQSVADLQGFLDDHVMKVAGMKGSPYAKPFKKELIGLERRLLATQSTIEVWLKVQQQWMYLEPVFGAPDIIKQMPHEGTLFRTVDRDWRDLMASVAKAPVAMPIATDETVQAKLRKALQMLDKIQSGLRDYLEKKRLFFPRFFFLSDDELLKILSQTRDPLQVQPHLKKCFEGIFQLTFAPNMDISAMQSKEGEILPMLRTINPNDANGAVEAWLKDVENCMFDSVQHQCAEALKAYPQTKRDQWVQQWQGQVVLTVNQIFWTKGVTDAIIAGKDALHTFLAKSKRELEDIVVLVRGKLDKLVRQTLTPLIVIDVHARDIVEELINDKVTDVGEFSWTSQLRYYWQDDNVYAKMINSEVVYGYEYLGNSSRLVITPLTDRCYRTLMGAIQLGYGGAPEGPAGTGKTETTKDLAKAVGIQCVVFNCSDQLDYLAMGKFFKGLAASGAWACFDEFNRIDLEVLSVVAQQIATIQHAKDQMLESFDFEQTKLPLKHTCNVFITMNPGYAGRSELPDNLKALFRSVAMMVPDYSMIAMILLYSYGFQLAQSLATKIVATYRLCSEQLSSQDHYDYGMRAVKTVLTAAENLKKAYPDKDENELMLDAITQVNRPKFLSQDLPLFDGILSDLFPSVELPAPGPAAVSLEDAVRQKMKLQGLQPVDSYVEKVMQLDQTINVRHGLMLVGLPYGGKTTAYKVLASALNHLAKQPGSDIASVKYSVINPKALTMGQLYGNFDPVSHEWTDGILAKKFKSFSDDKALDKKWLIFDGPVDAIWIENMNTVLDDNKKLCLMSGQIVRMSDTMNMIFEVRDLAAASPATVSRCGMVYFEPQTLGWEPLLDSWCQMLIGFSDKELDHIRLLFTTLLPPSLEYINTHCVQYCAAGDSSLASSLLTLLDRQLQPLVDSAHRQKMGAAKVTAALEGMFLFSLVWSVGAAVDGPSRSKFSAFLRDITSSEVGGNKLRAPFPSRETVYDFFFDSGEAQWLGWKELLNVPVEISPDTEFQNILVPTVDTTRYTALLSMFLQAKKPCLLVGPTGTGKTAYVYGKLRNMAAEYMSFTVNFSAQTSVNQTQMMIDSRLDKIKTGLYGPPPGKKMIIFVDDLNLPKQETYGAQPPIELLRQYMDHGGWYDLDLKNAGAEPLFRNLTDVQFVAAMGPPGGGRNPITDRFLRHFSQVTVTPFDDATVIRIFGTIMDWHLNSHEFPAEFSSHGQHIVQATLDMYKRACAELLPTPAKSHYTFNLRDMSRVVEGMTRSRPADFEQPEPFIRLWVHETQRVFADRLVDDGDRVLFLGWLRETVQHQLKQNFDQLFIHVDIDEDGKVDTLQETRNIVFGSYMEKRVKDRTYKEITEMKELRERWEQYLDAYNAVSSKPMNLVMFQFAIEHVSRIVRILSGVGGHALLVGVGGSGKQSLARLASSVLRYTVMTVELTKNYNKKDWHEDIRRILMNAGQKGEGTVFVFTDNQIKQESFLEDVNSILNSGSVPGLFDETMRELTDSVRQIAADQGAAPGGTIKELYDFFTSRVRENLHVVLCMSPVGGAFRERLLNYPSLVNNCTIDVFSSWPKDALRSVATQQLSTIDDMDQKTAQICADLCMRFHSDVEELSHQFFDTLRRHYYVTPTSYLELLRTFQTLLKEKRQQVSSAAQRYEVGLSELHDTGATVANMQVELQEMQPKLVAKDRTLEAKRTIISTEKVDADKFRQQVEGEEKKASLAASEDQAIKDDCQSELDKVMPEFNAAMAAVDQITNQQIAQVKGYVNPPPGVKLVMECICHIFSVDPTRKPDPSGSGRMVEDYWMSAKGKLLSNPNFKNMVMEFDKDGMSDDVVKMIRKYQKMPEFDPESLKKASSAAYALICWVYALEKYDSVNKIVKPKMADLKVAEEASATAQASLQEWQEKLQQVEARLKSLNDDLQQMEQEKKDLEEEQQRIADKLRRAEQLLGGLGGEQERWAARAKELRAQYKNLVGDVIISSGVIAYLGAFTPSFRQETTANWRRLTEDAGIPCSKDFSLSSVLGEAVQTRQWIIDGLPNDSFSIENAIILHKARRWPLCIDPQGQANKWLKNMEKQHKLVVIKANADYGRQLENAIQFGNPCLLENVSEQLDPTLEPLLVKNIITRGTNHFIKFGDQEEMDYSTDFRFFMTTKMPNPHYLPEVSTKVTLLNFMITQDGLEDQLLGIVVAKEKPELEKERNKLVVTTAENNRQLKEIEDRILHVISAAKGQILDDEQSIQILSASKKIANDIQEKQVVMDETNKAIEKSRAGYKPVAFHTSVLFFCIADLAQIDPMYQYSLDWFISLFKRSIDNSEFSHVLETRIHSLNDHFTNNLYTNVLRSLFEKDKLLFSFLLTVSILKAADSIDPDEWRFLITGGIAMDMSPGMNPAASWLPSKSWTDLNVLQRSLPAFAGIADEFLRGIDGWEKVYRGVNPFTETFPGKWGELTEFQKLCVLRCITPDKVIMGCREFISRQMGSRYIEFPAPNLEGAFEDSSPTSPIVFILSAGADPMSSIKKFAADKQVAINAVSLGQGQGPRAEALIKHAMEDGSWVILENCHLAVSWMPRLESICESIPPPIAKDAESKSAPAEKRTASTHPNFRLWLTSYPSAAFPASILQNGVKITTEPPKGLKANLVNSFSQHPLKDDAWFAECKRSTELRTMAFALCFFHALIQERMNFGSLGWNIPYGFNESDLKISVRQLKMFLDEAKSEIPYKALRYLTGECNYGGRVTDDWDRRTLMTLLSTFYNPDVHTDGFELTASGEYKIPIGSSVDGYVQYSQNLPFSTPPDVFGLHGNANITKDKQETSEIFQRILLTQARASSSGKKKPEEVMEELATDILQKLPRTFDIELVQSKYPVDYNESMNTVLVQECKRYNRLVSVITKSLVDLQDALKGRVVMNAALEQVGRSMFNSQVPEMWMAVSYPSLKPLGSYVADLVKRLQFLQGWIDNGVPSVVWISGIFFTHSFLTSVLQNYARKYKVPIDEVELDFELMGSDSDDGKMPPPADGAYVKGLFLEGARWNYNTKTLDEPKPKELFSPAPIIWLKPTSAEFKRTENVYECPVYRTSSRRGTLSTTGHSTNYVLAINIPSSKPAQHWVKRGVALLTQLDE